MRCVNNNRGFSLLLSTLKLVNLAKIKAIQEVRS